MNDGEQRTTAAPRPSLRATHRRAVSVVYVSSVLMVSMDPQIVNLMLPALGRAFDAPLASVQWAVIGYMVGAAIFMPVAGWLGDRFGTKAIWSLALIVFVSGSVAASLSPSLGLLVAFRVVQGAGGGMLTPIAGAMLFRAFAPSERAQMARTLFVPIMVGPILAHPIGGALVEYVSWRWAFCINVPIALGALWVSRSLVERRDPARRRLDLPGLVMSAAGLSMVTFGFTQAALRGWASASSIVPIGAGLVVLAVFMRHELRAPAPMLKVSLFANRIFRATNVVFVTNTVAFTALPFLVPVFVQQAMGESVLAASLTTFCMAIGLVVGTQTIGRLYGRIGPRRLVAGGCAGVALALASCLLIGADSSLWWMRAALFVGGTAQAALGLALHTAMFATVSADDMGSGSSLYYAGRQASGAVGVALLTSVVAAAGAGTVASFHTAFAVAAGIGLCAAVTALLMIHDSDAVDTLAGRRLTAAAE